MEGSIDSTKVVFVGTRKNDSRQIQLNRKRIFGYVPYPVKKGKFLLHGFISNPEEPIVKQEKRTLLFFSLILSYEREGTGVSTMKVMKTIFVLLAVVGLNLSLFAQNQQEAGDNRTSKRPKRRPIRSTNSLKGNLFPRMTIKTLRKSRSVVRR